MNTYGAALETVRRVRNSEKSLRFPKTGSLSLKHLEEMVERMSYNGLSAGKSNRWLGWIQCACVAGNALTLEQCKEINQWWSEKDH